MEEMARITKNPEIRKSELLDAAEGLFSKKGYDKTSINDIVHKVGVAQGTFYYHFSSKEEMVEALTDRYIESMLHKIIEIVGSERIKAVKKIEQIASCLMLANDKSELMEYVHREQNAILHLKMVRKSMERFMPYIFSVMEQGIQEGLFDIKYMDETSEVIFLVMEAVQESVLFTTDKKLLKIRSNAMAEILTRILGLKKGSIRL
jgi:AcrR family transcriptional regulator